MISLKNPDQIGKMREAGALLYEVMQKLREAVKPGVSTAALDVYAEQLIRKNHAIPTSLHYEGYPASICTSVDDAVVHGIPSESQILKEGSIVSIDCTLMLDGWQADSAFTVGVGEISAQAEALIKAGARVYVPYGLGSFEGAAGAIIPAVYKKLPKKLDCSVVVAGSIGAAEYARGLGKSVIADYSMNIFNSVSAEEFETVTLSTELTLAEMKKITASFNTEAVVYGYIPLMKTKNCIIKTVGKCAGSCADCRKSIKLRDRKNAVFTVKSDGEFNTLYNSVPLFMADRINELKDAGFTGLRLCFTNESPREAVKIYKMYAGEAAIEKPSAYTRGHFYSGV